MAPRTAVLVRHAHADWPNYAGRDFDRPLTPRGGEEAQATARSIIAAGMSPTLLLASPARRTRQTAEVLAAALGLADDRVRFIDALYNAKSGVLEAELRRAAPAASATMLVAHNPGISELARILSANARLPPFPPAGWASFTLPDVGA